MEYASIDQWKRKRMTGIYIKCEKCSATFGGEEASRDEAAKYPRGLGWTDGQKLREEAAKRGWTGKGDFDLCPNCSDSAGESRG